MRFARSFVVVVLLVCLVQTAKAQTATLILPDLCQNPVTVFNYQWTTAQGSTALFFMDGHGNVTAVQAALEFKDYPKIFVVAHGGASRISAFTYPDFAAHLALAHPSVPTEIVFLTCFSYPALAQAVYSKYGQQVSKILAAEPTCSLVGNGDPQINNATPYRQNAGYSDKGKFDDIAGDITTKWETATVPALNNHSYQSYCMTAVGAANANDIQTFINAVINTLTDQYGQLIALRTGGDDLKACGRNPSGNGEEVKCE